MKLGLRQFLLLFGLLAGWFCHAQPGYSQSNDLIISRVGLSQAHGTTYLTMILSRNEQPKITPVTDRQSPQLFLDFPKARVFDVPTSQAGDQQLVQQVRTTALPGGDGVRVILDLVPGRPYSFWRSSKAGDRGGYQYMVGIRPDSPGGDTSAGLAAASRPLTTTPEPAAPPPPPRTYTSDRESTQPAAPGERTEAESSRTLAATPDRRPTSSSMSEVYQIMPPAGPVLAFLEQKGWSVQKNSPGRAGSSGGRKFLLESSQHPNLSITAEHIPTRGQGSPGINVIALSTDKIADSDADKYRQMLRWDLATIKKHFEDIGDYYDDGLKPLRIRLRERSKAVVLRDYEFYQQFLEAAVPQQPELAEKIKKQVQDKVIKRLEGGLFTESENPLVIMDMVDFYTLRVYFIGR